MKLAVMQPYFFPYIGYFQLMAAVDMFVFLDDVQYVDRSWMNRNRILLGCKPHWLSFPVHKAPRATSICLRRYLLGEECDSVLRRIRAAYGSFPYYAKTVPVLERILRHADPSVAGFNGHALQELAGRLGIRCGFDFSSARGNPEGLHGQDRILDLCTALDARTYINPIGGTSLYEAPRFSAASLALRFLRTTCPLQQTEDGPMHLSIIDLLMRHGFEGVAGMLDQQEIIDSPAESEP